MKKEPDFSKAERGKFYHPDTKLVLPIYLDAEVQSFLQDIAKKRNVDLSTTVNKILRKDMQLAQAMR